MLAHKIASLALALEANAEDPRQVRHIGAVLHGYAAELRDRERETVPPHLRRPTLAVVVPLEERRAPR